MNTDFRLQLAKQLRFLETSCRAFDEGDIEEAIRLAVSMRVMFHDRGRSISLLSHLGVRNTLELYTDASDLGGKAEFADMLTSWSGAGPAPKLRLASGERRKFVPANIWWDEIVYVMAPVRVSRGDLVRFAADKDGGAHVDAQQDPTYMLLQSMWVRQHDWGDPSAVDVTRIGLRTLAFQLLSSPELLALGLSE